MIKMLDEKDILQCHCCGNRNYSGFIKRDNGRLCKCCGVWYQTQTSHEDMMAEVRCEAGYSQLRTYRFDDARDAFENVLMEDPNNISALWGVLLARFGVVFIKGFYKNVVEPIYCFQNYDRMKNRYVQSEREYIKLMELLKDDNELRYDYERKAQKIDDAIDDFKRYKEETERDVFICVKISAATQNNPELKGTTKDYELAMRLYEDLEARGVNTFFSYVTLKNDVDSDEKIWRNLVKSKKMLLVASSEEYLESPWVKSEWKRWLFLKREKDLYIYVLNKPGETPYDILPNEFANNQIYTAESYKKLLKDVCEGLNISPADVARKKREAEQKKQEAERQKREEELKRNKPKKKKTQLSFLMVMLCVTVLIIGGIVASSAGLFNGSDSSVSTTVATSTNTRADASTTLSGVGITNHTVQTTTPTVTTVGTTVTTNSTTQTPTPTVPQGLAYRVISDTTCEITGIGTCMDTDLVIPKYIDGYEVTSIGSGAFWNCYSLTSIEIPNSVTSIGDAAFENCTGLTSIIVSDGNEAYKSVDGVLFTYNKKTLVCYPAGKPETSYIIPNSVTSIGDSAFYNCTGLKSITIPNSVTSIGGAAFAWCVGLTSITIPNSVISIGGAAFQTCIGLTDISIPNSVTSIGNYAFFDCTGLTSITIGESVTSIGDSAFYNCTGLMNITYNGTISEWKTIAIGTDWNANTPEYIIYCTDGTIAKNGTVTYK